MARKPLRFALFLAKDTNKWELTDQDHMVRGSQAPLSFPDGCALAADVLAWANGSEGPSKAVKPWSGVVVTAHKNGSMSAGNIEQRNRPAHDWN